MIDATEVTRELEPEEPPRQQCDGCAFWRQGSTRAAPEGAGHCRRHPPVIVDVTRTTVWASTAWPSVTAFDWCGDFKRIGELT